MQSYSVRIVFCGHTHSPMIIRLDAEDGKPREEKTRAVNIGGGGSWIFNPGSAGQPRDGSTRPSYAIFDSESGDLEIKRFAYPVEKTMDKTLKRNLKNDRMLVGYMKRGR